jgi:hypothetical protein
MNGAKSMPPNRSSGVKPATPAKPRASLDLLQQECRQLLGREFSPAEADQLALAHLALERRCRPLGVGRGLTAGRLAHEHLAIGGERHVARERLAPERHTLGARDDDGPTPTQHGRRRVRSAEIDADNRHLPPPFRATFPSPARGHLPSWPRGSRSWWPR